MSEYSLFTSESVSEGHPDKIADQISDAVLDAIIAEDKFARVACETLVKTGVAIIAGEVTTSAWVDLEQIVRDVITDIGYTSSDVGIAAVDGDDLAGVGVVILDPVFTVIPVWRAVLACAVVRVNVQIAQQEQHGPRFGPGVEAIHVAEGVLRLGQDQAVPADADGKVDAPVGIAHAPAEVVGLPAGVAFPARVPLPQHAGATATASLCRAHDLPPIVEGIGRAIAQRLGWLRTQGLRNGLACGPQRRARDDSTGVAAVHISSDVAIPVHREREGVRTLGTQHAHAGNA